MTDLLSALGRPFEDKQVARLIVAFLGFASLILMLSWDHAPAANLRVGEVSPRDYTSDRDLEFENVEATRDARVRAANNTGTIFTADPGITLQAQNNITTSFDILRRMQPLKAQGEDQKARQLRASVPLAIKDQSVNFLVSLNPPTMSQVEKTIKDLLGGVMRGGVPESGLAQGRKLIRDQARALSLPQPFADVIGEVASAALLPNVRADERATLLKQQDAMVTAGPAMTYIRKGQIILRKGDVVTPQHLEYLRVLNAQEQPGHIFRVVTAWSALALIVIMLALVYYYQRRLSLVGEKAERTAPAGKGSGFHW